MSDCEIILLLLLRLYIALNVVASATCKVWRLEKRFRALLCLYTAVPVRNQGKFEQPRDPKYKLKSIKLLRKMEDGLLVKAFDVDDVPDNFDPSKPPASGEEYLQHVMFEASQCPQVVVADIDRSKIKCNSDKHLDTDDSDSGEGNELSPTSEWQEHQVSQFSELREKVNRYRHHKSFQPIPLPDPYDEEKWYGIFFGDEVTRMTPYLSVLLSMSELTLGQLLEYHVDWLEEGLKPDQAAWIYAMMACLSRPLTSDVCSTLRQLARNCAKLRSGKTLEDPDVIPLNLIICLVRKYFGQLDLAD